MDYSKFNSISKMDGGYVTFGDNAKEKIIVIGEIGNPNSLIIDNVLFVNGLKHNLLSISQLCDKCYKIIFQDNACKAFNKNNTLVFVALRDENVYTIDFDNLVEQNVLIYLNSSLIKIKLFSLSVGKTKKNFF